MKITKYIALFFATSLIGATCAYAKTPLKIKPYEKSHYAKLVAPKIFEYDETARIIAQNVTADFGEAANALIYDVLAIPYNLPERVEQYFKEGGKPNLESQGQFLLGALLKGMMVNPKAIFYDEGDLVAIVKSFTSHGFDGTLGQGKNGADALKALVYDFNRSTYRHGQDVTQAFQLLLNYDSDPHLVSNGKSAYNVVVKQSRSSVNEALRHIMESFEHHSTYQGIDCIDSLKGRRITRVLAVPLLKPWRIEAGDGRIVYTGAVIFDCEGELLIVMPGIDYTKRLIVHPMMFELEYEAEFTELSASFKSVIGETIIGTDRSLNDSILYLSNDKQIVFKPDIRGARKTDEVVISLSKDDLPSSTYHRRVSYDKDTPVFSEEDVTAFLNDFPPLNEKSVSYKKGQLRDRLSDVFQLYLQNGPFDSPASFWKAFAKRDIYYFKGPLKQKINDFWKLNDLAKKRLIEQGISKEECDQVMPFARLFSNFPQVYSRRYRSQAIKNDPYFAFINQHFSIGWASHAAIYYTIHYESDQKPRVCPACGHKPVSTIVYGARCQGKTVEKGMRAGHLISGGCAVDRYDPKWECANSGFKYFRTGTPYDPNIE